MSWIVVGLHGDVPRGVAVPARVSGTDLAIWCSASGTHHAWGDRCPHRGMRLSHGFVRGENLACIYHGWQYGDDGACTYIPAHPDLTPPKTICATTYACAAQDGLIWVSLEPTDTAPPAVAMTPVRSLTIRRSATAVAAHMGQEPGAFLHSADRRAVALQPVDAQTCALHGLTETDRDRHATSRWMEELRRELETAA